MGIPMVPAQRADEVMVGSDLEQCLCLLRIGIELERLLLTFSFTKRLDLPRVGH